MREITQGNMPGETARPALKADSTVSPEVDFLSELEGDGDVGGHIHGPAVACCRAEADLLSYALGFLIKAVTQATQDSLNGNLPVSQEGYAQNHIALHLHLSSFSRIPHRGL